MRKVNLQFFNSKMGAPLNLLLIISRNLSKLIYPLFNIIVCPPGYIDYFSGSENCFKKVVKLYHTWELGKKSCENDNATLACFGTQDERNHMTNECPNCFVGYKWQNGTYQCTCFGYIEIIRLT